MRKHLRYLSYVIRHKFFVLVAGRKTGAPLWRLLIHDWSKFLPSEWKAYAEYFYGYWADAGRRPDHSGDGCPICRFKDRAAAAFDRAWLHHQHANPHHWQHWVLREDSGDSRALRMPEHFVREMVADWMGAGRAITGKWEVRAWYSKNNTRMILHSNTRRLVEALVFVEKL